MLGPSDQLRPFDRLRVNGVGVPSQSRYPFGLSLSKALDLCTGPFDKLRPFDRLRMLGPFDKLRVNGGGVPSQSRDPFGLSPSKALDLCTRSFEEVKASRGRGPQPAPPLESRPA